MGRYSGLKNEEFSNIIIETNRQFMFLGAYRKDEAEFHRLKVRLLCPISVPMGQSCLLAPRLSGPNQGGCPERWNVRRGRAAKSP